MGRQGLGARQVIRAERGDAAAVACRCSAGPVCAAARMPAEAEPDDGQARERHERGARHFAIETGVRSGVVDIVLHHRPGAAGLDGRGDAAIMWAWRNLP